MKKMGSDILPGAENSLYSISIIMSDRIYP
jgi:hypothetical protein